MGIIEDPTLSAFKKVAQAGSVHAAAKDLGITQTAVTKRIKMLEGALGLTLFLRSRRGMRLTDDGMALLHHCKAVDELEGTFVSRITGEKKYDSQITIVGPTSAISTRVVLNCHDIYEKYPNVRLHLRSDDHANLIELVRRGEADMAIVPPEQVPNEMDSKLLKPDRYILVGSPRWKGRPLRDILEQERIIDFYEADPTTRNYLKKFGLDAIPKKGRIFVNENEALIRLFSAGFGFGTLTESVARPHLEAGQLISLNRGQVMEDPLAVAWYPRTQKANYFIDLIRTLK